MAVAYVVSVRRNYPRYASLSARWFCCELSSARCLRSVIPLVIILGIVFGVFTATEAGAMTVLVAAAIGIFCTRA
jgi:TRAP-type C4-dicarboxylate transport system permease large subunit